MLVGRREMVKVSVIVPVYNTSQYLVRCMEALVNQTLGEIEILAVNDGSTDNSLEILKRYEEQYPGKVRVLTKENGGQATARNLGIRESKGEYIGFADSDDCVDRTIFEKLYRLAKKDDSDMVECHYHYLQETGGKTKELKTRGNIRAYGNRKNMFIDPQVSPWNKLYRREVLQKGEVTFPEGLIYEDTAFYIKSIPFVEKESYLAEHLVYYYLRGSSTMNANKSRKVADIFAVLGDILDFYKTKGFYEEYREELEYFCVKILLCSSLSRVGRVTDHALKEELLSETFRFVKENFPGYRRNKYFSGKIGCYIRFVNRSNSRWISTVLGRIMKG